MKWLHIFLVFGLITDFLITADYSSGIKTITIDLSPSEVLSDFDDPPADPDDPPTDPTDPPGDPADPPGASVNPSTSPAPAAATPMAGFCFNPASLPATRAGCPARPASVPPTNQGCYGTACPAAVPCASQIACPATSASPGCQIQTLNYSYPANTEIKLDIQNPQGFCWGAPCSNNESVVAVINTIDPRNLTPLATHRHILRSLIPGTTKVIQNQWDTTKNCIAFSQVYDLVVTPKLAKQQAIGTQTSLTQTGSTSASPTQTGSAQTGPVQVSSTQSGLAQTSSAQASPTQTNLAQAAPTPLSQTQASPAQTKTKSPKLLNG